MRDLVAWIIILFYTSVAALIAIPILGDQNFYSDDLGSHIALTLRLAAIGGDPWFYDRAWFSGFPAFELYGFIPHWLASTLVDVLDDGWSEATRAVHAVTAFCIAILPLSAWWFVSGWQRDDGKNSAVIAGGLVLVLGLFLTFFDLETIGGLEYIVVGGVYAQMPGWILMLIYLGTLGRAVRTGCSVDFFLIVLFSLTIATHPFTAVAALLVAMLLIWSFLDWRRALLHAGLAIATSAWFWLPIVAWSPEYGVGDPHSGDATIISIYSDRWIDFLYGIQTSVLGLVAEIVFALALGVTLYQAVFGLGRLYSSVLLIVLASLVLAGAEFAEAIPLTLHYDRLIVALSVVAGLLAVVGCAEALPKMPRIAELVVAGVLMIVGSQITLQAMDLHPFPNTTGWDALVAERMLLDELDSLPPDSRVYFERSMRTSGSELSPGKFLEARLWSATGIETVNGLLIQSSRPYQLYATIGKKLRARTFSSQSIAWDQFGLNGHGMMDVFRRNSITHIVSANEHFTLNLNKLDSIQPIVKVGRYTVYAIDDAKPRLRVAEKPVIGYADMAGTLPFHFLDMFVEVRAPISGRVRLVSLQPGDIHSVPVDALVINSEKNPDSSKWRMMTVLDGRQLPVLKIGFESHALDRYTPRDRFREKRRFDQAAEYMLKIGLDRQIWGYARGKGLKDISSVPVPDFEWSGNGQVVRFDGLSAGRWYEFAYSEFPAWVSDSMDVRHGSAGHWMIHARQGSAEAEYHRWGTKPVVYGWLLTLAGLLGFAFRIFRQQGRRWQ